MSIDELGRPSPMATLSRRMVLLWRCGASNGTRVHTRCCSKLVVGWINLVGLQCSCNLAKCFALVMVKLVARLLLRVSGFESENTTWGGCCACNVALVSHSFECCLLGCDAPMVCRG